MKKKGHLFFIMWVSGGGKWTIRWLLQAEDNDQIEFMRSYVTRSMRPWEVNGDVYWFVSTEEFEQGIEENDFLEYEINHKVAYYGTKKSEVEKGLSDWKILIKEIDTKGLIQLHENHPEFRENYTSIFLDISNEQITKRFYERHPDGKKIDLDNRIESASFEREQAETYCDYIIDGDQDKIEVFSQIKKIIKL